MSSKTLSITVHTDDQRTLSALAGLFLDLSGEYEDTKAPEIAGVPQAPVLTPSVPEAPVNTAAVFGGLDVAPQAPAAPQAPTPPVTPQAPTAAPPAGVPLDKSGLPWDTRINTSNKAQTAKGIWKRVPKISDELYEATLAELKQIMAAPAAAPAPAPVAPTPPVAATPPAPPTTPASPAAPAAPVRTMLNGADYDAYVAAGWTDQQMIDAGHMTLTTPAAPSAPDEAEPTTYAQLLGVVAPRIAAKKITHEEVSGVCAAAGLPDLNSVSARPDLVGTIYQGCKAIWATRG